MKIVFYFCIVLCLVVDTYARSAKSTHDESDVEVLSPVQSAAEGICRHKNKTYQNREKFVSDDPCLYNCTCINSVVKCDTLDCVLRPPKSGINCKVKRIPGKCCPVYVCECDCGSNSIGCKFIDNEKTCECLDFFEQKGETCKGCYCGPNAVSCQFSNDEKICTCKEGHSEINGICQKCDCGSNSIGCEFIDNEKTCECEDFFEQKDETCKECDCGSHSVGCKFIENEKTCECEKYYEQKGETCEDCYCGPNAVSCQFSNDERICTCKEGHSEIYGICRKCDCGSNSVGCKFIGSEKTCECADGYDQKGETCEEILFPSTTSATTLNSTGFSTHHPTVSETNNTTPRFNFSTIVSDLTTTSNETTSTVLPSTFAPTTSTDVCSQNYCQNGGTCVVVDNKSSKCLCRKPYLGILCETDPCDWNPCKNGGICKIENETMKCFCKEPFTGEFCDSRIKIDAYVITLVAASVFLAIVLIFVTCVLCQRYYVMKR